MTFADDLGSRSNDLSSFPQSPRACVPFISKAIVESVLTHSFMDIPGKFMSMLDRSDDHTVVRKTFVGQVQLCTHIVFQTLTT